MMYLSSVVVEQSLIYLNSSMRLLSNKQQAKISTKLKILFHDCLIQAEATLQNQQINLKLPTTSITIMLDFWSIFQPFSNQKAQTGFAIKVSETQNYIFYTDDEQTVKEWKNKFSKIGIIRGFYQDFKPLQKIGSGKSASVFLAKRRENGQKLAVKAFSKTSMKADPLSMQALQNETKILRQSSCSNIVRFQGLYETEKSFYMITQYIEGKTLRNLLETQQIKYYEVKNILKNILLGLHYLSNKGIAHRDLKPQNILIENQTNRAVILDFGLATFCNHPKEYIYIHCGTPGFIAPEILDEYFYEVSPKSDIFSLGIIFHLLMLRKFPYKNITASNIIEQNKFAQFDFENIEYDEIPSQVKILLKRMLSRRHRQRPSAKELIEYFETKQNKLSPRHILGFKRQNIRSSRKNLHREQVLQSLNRSNSLKTNIKARLQKAY